MADTSGIDSLIKIVQQISREAGKPLFIGEFGVKSLPDRQKERSDFKNLLDAIEANNVPLAALWVFDLDNQKDTWNITFTNDRAYMLTLTSRKNKK